MGNQGSKSEYGGICVQMDHAYCVSGQAVTGRIHVQIDKPFPAKKLVIKIKGKEKCKWTEQRSREVGQGKTLLFNIFRRQQKN